MINSEWIFILKAHQYFSIKLTEWNILWFIVNCHPQHKHDLPKADAYNELTLLPFRYDQSPGALRLSNYRQEQQDFSSPANHFHNITLYITRIPLMHEIGQHHCIKQPWVSRTQIITQKQDGLHAITGVLQCFKGKPSLASQNASFFAVAYCTLSGMAGALLGPMH